MKRKRKKKRGGRKIIYTLYLSATINWDKETCLSVKKKQDNQYKQLKSQSMSFLGEFCDNLILLGNIYNVRNSIKPMADMNM